MFRIDPELLPDQATGLIILRIPRAAGISFRLCCKGLLFILTMFTSLFRPSKALAGIVKGLSLLAILSACSTDIGVYKAYLGTPRENLQVAQVNGAQFIRTDWINRYIDAVRFLAVDGIVIDNPEEFRSVQIEPGYHDLKVYFSWDLGSQRGLAPALVNYAANRDTMNRTLRFNALAGERYTVQAEPVFNSQRHDITDLLYVDFWIEDRDGNEIVSRESGRYLPGSTNR